MSSVRNSVKMELGTKRIKIILYLVLGIMTAISIYYLYTQVQIGRIQYIMANLNLIDPTYLAVALLTVGVLVPTILGLYLVVYYVSKLHTLISSIEPRQPLDIEEKLSTINEINIKLDTITYELNELRNILNSVKDEIKEVGAEEAKVEYTSKEESKDEVEVAEGSIEIVEEAVEPDEKDIEERIMEIRSLVQEIRKVGDELKKLKEMI